MSNDYGLPLGDLLNRIDPNHPKSVRYYTEDCGKYEPPKENRRGSGSSILDEIESILDEDERTKTTIKKR